VPIPLRVSFAAVLVFLVGAPAGAQLAALSRLGE
jgi:hypothetical protein